MALTRDTIDAVSMMLYVDGELTFSILLTRGGLTKRFGWSEPSDRQAVMATGGTECFDDFMAAVPESLLERGARLEDDGTEGPRHDWTIEFASSPDSLSYHIGFHWGSASLPDEFADLVVRAEALTHAWYMRQIADETDAPPVAATERPRRERSEEPRDRASTGPRGRPGRTHPVPAKRERIALAVLIDLIALSIPYSLIHGILIGDAERTGPPGGALMLFAIVEFGLLQIARTSPGFWLLEISWPHGDKPRVDPARTTKESTAMLAVGTGLLALGVGFLTAWTTYHTPVPYFGLSFPLWLSIPVTMLGSAALVIAGALVLQLDLRGVWLGSGLVVLMLLGSALGWSDWSGFIAAAMGVGADGPGSSGLVSDLAPFIALAVLALLGWGLFESWKRLGRAPVGAVGSPRMSPGPTR
ncbi:MAG: hypothetical protein PVJ80_11480 [Gemmatimonadota bacterium]|jgi:hypothetical protein